MSRMILPPPALVLAWSLWRRRQRRGVPDAATIRSDGPQQPWRRPP
jgi:hypothetical protein